MDASTRGFKGRGRSGSDGRLPPGQQITDGFPVLSIGPTPQAALLDWALTLKVGPKPMARWTWDQIARLPRTFWRGDIHCVTTWSKFDTEWEGVTVDAVLGAAGLDPEPYLLAHSADGYSTNLSTSDVIDGKAMVALSYNGRPIPAEHGGPARLLVPHLYFWKSAKWLTGLQFLRQEELGFWELRGYHRRGDPFAEERYSDD
jgi:DMSO/TMAO reductase YedYZ molybdopterin-dependent catalytic subunit